MNLSFLETMVSVLRLGSFASAAADRNLSPSAVSLQMRRLEEYFGQPLFDRSSQQARPTAFAHELAQIFSSTLQTMEDLRQRTNHAVEGEVKLGVTESMQAFVLPPALSALRAKYAQLVVKPVRGRSQTLIDQVKSGEIDAAVVVQSPSGGARRLRWDLLLQEPLVLIAPPDSPENTLEDLLRNHELIRFEGSANVGRLGMRFLTAKGIKPRGNVELQSVLPIVALVSSGLGVSIAFMPDRRSFTGYPVREISLGADAPQMRVAFVTRPQQDDSRAVQAVREAVAQAVAQRKRLQPQQA